MSEHLLTSVENNQIIEILKVQVTYLILGNVLKIDTFELSTVSVFHRFTYFEWLFSKISKFEKKIVVFG